MDCTYMSEQNGGHSNLSRLLLLLFLAGLQPVQSSAGEQLLEQRVDVSIAGPDYVTVGVPSSVECVSNCPTCTYSMSVSGQTAQGHGNALAFTVKTWVKVLTVTCTVTDDNRTVNDTATKQLQVLAGPANISITGFDVLNTTMNYTYSCHAYCWPSCTYAWKTLNNPRIDGQGNTISITPQEFDSPEDVLICTATNSVSGMFVAATQQITVTRVDVSIVGPDYVTVGVPSSVECVSNCPTCTYSMSVSGQTAQGHGNALVFTVKTWVKVLTVTCTVTDDNRTENDTARKQLQVLAGPANVSITGPNVINTTMSYTYSCHAYCRPFCTYAWKTLNNPRIDGQGNTISITPQEFDSPEDVLICTATNSVSGMFVAATQQITVIGSGGNLSARPNEISAVLLLAFITSAAFML